MWQHTCGKHSANNSDLVSAIGSLQPDVGKSIIPSKYDGVFLLYFVPLDWRTYASHCPLRSDSIRQSARHRTSSRPDQKGDDRSAHEADRAGCSQESSSPLPAGTLLWPVLLRRTKRALVRTS